MITKIKILLIAGLFMTLMSCEKNTDIRPSDNITNQFAEITGYTGLVINGTFKAEVRFSDSDHPIEIIANENLHQYIYLENQSNILRIGIKDNVNIVGPAQLKVILTSGYLSNLTANGASEILLADSLITERVNILLTGASKMEGTISVQTLMADLHDASFLGLSGNTVDYQLTVSGASKAYDYSLVSNKLDADLSDASEVRLTVTDLIEISASSASTLNYRGSAVINSQSLTGASKVVKTD